MAPPAASERVALPDWAVGLALATAVTLCFAAVLVTRYAATDDYYHLARVVAGSGPFTFLSSLARGCPTSAFATWWAFQGAGSLGGLRWMRAAGVLGIALLALVLYRALKQAGWSPGRAALIAFLICTTPPFQCCGSWAVMFTVAYSCLLTGLACQQTVRALACTAPRDTLRHAVYATLLLLVAVTIYQVTLMYFIVFAAIDLFRPQADPPRMVRRILVLGGVMAAGLALGFAAYQIGKAFYGSALTASRAQMASSLSDKATFFYEGPLRDALQLSKLFPTPWLPGGIAAAIVIGLMLYFHGGIGRRLLHLLLAMVAIPAVYLPNLMTSEDWGAYRTQLSLTSLMMLFACFALHGWARLLGRVADRVGPALLAAATVLAGLSAAHNVAWYYAEAQSTEIRVASAQLRKLDLEKIETLRIKPADWTDAVTTVRYDEFGLPTSTQLWAQIPMMYVLASENLGHPPRFSIELAIPHRLVLPPEGFVDMTRLSDFALPPW